MTSNAKGVADREQHAHGLQSVGLRRTPNRSRRKRRGALLLVCLSLLVLFAVIALTFVLITSQYWKSSRSEGKFERHGDDYKKQIHLGVGQLIYGTSDSSHSSIKHHDILGDEYGDDGISGFFNTTNSTTMPLLSTYLAGTPLASGQVIDLPPLNASGINPRFKFSGYLNGLVFTFQDGPARGISTRIIGYKYDSSADTSTFRILAFDGLDTATFINGFNLLLPNQAIRFVVNGRPFNGSGFGFNAGTGRIDAKDSSAEMNPLALLPHHRFVSGASMLGGADEDFDAADMQSMHLAMMPPGATQSGQIMPSFHRPDLVNYWVEHLKIGDPTITDWNTLVSQRPDIARQIVLRPLASDHPNFSGSNPNFNALTGPWDVDNEGDGVPDSLWLDLGFPVQTAPDGRQFKPLFAFLCIDLDSRLNVNAHGSLADVDSGPDGTPGTADDAMHGTVNNLNVIDGSNAAYFAGQETNATPWQISGVSRGLGYGPAETSLLGIWDVSDGTRYQKYGALFRGDSQWEGRYGEQANGAWPYSSTTHDAPHPGRLADLSSLAAAVNTDDLLSAVKQSEFYAIPNAFSSPSDLWGRRFVGLDLRGAPIWNTYGAPSESMEIFDDPYEINLSQKTVRAAATGIADNTFTVAELERVLRPFDVDASSLPDRLRALLVTSGGVPNRHVVTTDSWDPPVSSFTMPPATPPTASVSEHIIDLYKRNMPTVLPTDMEAELDKLLPPELIAGLRMDVNRPFGNGGDDNDATSGVPNGVVDEIGEGSAGTEKVWNHSGLPANYTNVPFDANNDGGLRPAMARQTYARHLYALVMMLKGPTVQIDFDPIDNTNPSAETARGLAQWAINVVDYRDRDSTMTPFEYDKNPYDGWAPDGDLTTTSEADRAMVWGCERPELLITETGAGHDRRTEDLADPDGKFPPDPNNPMPPDDDEDFDQRLRPMGWLYVELFNPWSVNEALPGEFYYDDGSSSWADGVILNKVVPGGTSPIWRLIIVEDDSHNDGRDPDDAEASPAFDPQDVERAVYFTGPPPSNMGLTDPDVLAYSVRDGGGAGPTIAPVPPGRFAVIGPGMKLAGSDTYVTMLGRRKASAGVIDDPNGDQTTPRDLQVASTRRVELTAAATSGGSHALVHDNRVAGPDKVENTDVKAAIGIPVNFPHRLSISEPIGTAGDPFYEDIATYDGALVDDPVFQDAEGAYEPPKDEPIDAGRTGWEFLGKNEVKPRFRTIHLQRLANPLIEWHAELNPYRTVDSAAVDLIPYNGAADDTVDPDVGGASTGLWTHQRGDQNGPPFVINNIWRQEASAGATPNEQAGTDTSSHFNFIFKDSLGYLTQDLPAASLGKPTAFPNVYDATNIPPDAQYLGMPRDQPFPWLTWNNRPFIGPYELMLVPKSSSSRLLREYSLLPANSTEAYTQPTAPQISLYGHLLNFYESKDSAGTVAGAMPLYRVFDHLRVPSPFIGTETFLNPTDFTGADFIDGNSNGAYDPGEQLTGRDKLHPPFNRVSNYRDPGRVNINTILDQRVWNALMERHNTANLMTWQAVVDSRRGYGAAGSGIVSLDASSPTIFANPFRASGSSRFSLPETPNGVKAMAGNLQETDVTLMRETTGGEPLFRVNYNSGATIAEAYHDSNRNPYFRYQELQRISNLVTTRSNVFAIWVTMGYFEVEPNKGPLVTDPVIYDTVHPDGYRLTQELGADSGEITRHRAFYIYDRSIPVGYERGKDLNFERGILLKRVIE